MLRTKTDNVGDLPTRLPPWMRRRLRKSEEVTALKKKLREMNLHTVCQSAGCPNIAECFQKPTATFMILGNVCTRNCRFCGVAKGIPLSVDMDEPRRIGEAARMLGLRHVVVTSVTRDDLEDGGASQFTRTVEQIHISLPDATVEVLIPDFKGNIESLKTILNCNVDILNHNVETIPRLYKHVRPEADFERSLSVLKNAKSMCVGVTIKSGLMVGLGEKFDEVVTVLERLHEIGCDVITIGQYLAPSRQSYPVLEFVLPETFDAYREAAMNIGIPQVSAGAFVRSSFNAEEMMAELRGENGE